MTAGATELDISALDDSLADAFRRALLAGGNVTDSAARNDLAQAFIDTLARSTAYTFAAEVAPTPERLESVTEDRLAAGWMLLHRESPARALFVKPRLLNTVQRTKVLAALDDACSALESLLDFTDRHRVTYPGHDHDCYENWKIERDYARTAIATGLRVRQRGTETEAAA